MPKAAFQIRSVGRSIGPHGERGLVVGANFVNF